jgi:hypothetical protein
MKVEKITRGRKGSPVKITRGKIAKRKGSPVYEINNTKMEDIFLEGLCNQTLNTRFSIPHAYKDEDEYARALFKKRYSEDIDDVNDIVNSDYCKPFIVNTNINPPCIERKICVLDFQSKVIYTNTNNICDTDNPVGYKIMYYQITHAPEDLDAIKIMINEVCTETIIYVYDTSELLYDYIKDFIIKIKDFNKTTLFLITRDEKFISNQFLIENKITGLKILNIVSHNYLWNNLNCHCRLYTRYEINNTNYFATEYNFTGENFMTSFTLKLECTWWFKYYIAKAFDCGTGRLMQYSGTCYLNAVVNAIILSPNFRNIFITYMKRDLRQNPELHSYVKKDIYELACSTTEPNEVAYIYRIIYNICCKQKTLTKSIDQKDLFIHASTRYFSPNTDPTKKLYGQGGNPLEVFHYLLAKINIPFAFFSSQLYNPPYIQSLDISKMRDNRIMQGIPSVNKMDIVYKQVLYVENELFEVNGNMPIFEILTDKNSYKFNLEFCLISITFKKKDEKNPLVHDIVNHVIVGYRCNGQYKIYDSSTNFIENIDWSRLDDPNIYTQCKSIIEKYWLKNNIVGVENIKNIFAVYVNSNTIDEYSRTGTC